MRFFLSLILSSFFFIAPFQGSARVAPGKPLTSIIEKSTPTTTLADYSVSNDYTGDVINSGHRNSSTTQYRFFPFANFINTVAFPNRINLFYEEKLFIQPHLYCKRIGLKLVFPEHYFW